LTATRGKRRERRGEKMATTFSFLGEKEGSEERGERNKFTRDLEKREKKGWSSNLNRKKKKMEGGGRRKPMFFWGEKKRSTLLYNYAGKGNPERRGGGAVFLEGKNLSSPKGKELGGEPHGKRERGKEPSIR